MYVYLFISQKPFEREVQHKSCAAKAVMINSWKRRAGVVAAVGVAGLYFQNQQRANQSFKGFVRSGRACLFVAKASLCYNRSVKQFDDALEKAKATGAGQAEVEERSQLVEQTQELRLEALRKWQKATAQDLLALCIVNGGTYCKFGQVRRFRVCSPIFSAFLVNEILLRVKLVFLIVCGDNATDTS